MLSKAALYDFPAKGPAPCGHILANGEGAGPCKLPRAHSNALRRFKAPMGLCSSIIPLTAPKHLSGFQNGLEVLFRRADGLDIEVLDQHLKNIWTDKRRQ